MKAEIPVGLIIPLLQLEYCSFVSTQDLTVLSDFWTDPQITLHGLIDSQITPQLHLPHLLFYTLLLLPHSLVGAKEMGCWFSLRTECCA